MFDGHPDRFTVRWRIESLIMTNIQDFYKTCDSIKAEWRSPNQINEQHYIDALNFIKKNKLYKNEILDYFFKIIKGQINDMPIDLIKFCMRELKWVEIKNFVEDELEKGDPRVRYLLEGILKVYDAEWEDSDLYQYYSK